MDLRKRFLIASLLLLSSGIAFAIPPEVAELRFTDKSHFEWLPAPGVDAYNVYRGNLADLPDYGPCLYQEVPLPDAADGTDPLPGEVHFYVITGTKYAHEGTMGYRTDGAERFPDIPCFTLPPPIIDYINPDGPDADGVWKGVEAPRNPGIANDLTGLACGGVYLHTGEFFVRETDLETKGRGMNWRHARSYRSQINHDGIQGANWTFNYDRRVMPGAVGIVYLDGTGREDEYQLSMVSGLFEPVERGIYKKIRETAAGFTLRERDGTLYHHFPLAGDPWAGRLEWIEDRLGNRMRFLYYPSGQLAAVVDTLGRNNHYYWNHEGRLGSVVDHSGREVRYEYDLGGNLIAVTTPPVIGTSTGNDFPFGKRTEYGYALGTGDPQLDHNLLTVTAPGDTDPMIDNSYNLLDELQNQFCGGTNDSGIPAGGLYEYTIDKDAANRLVDVIDRNGIEHNLGFDEYGHLTIELGLTAGIRPGEPPAYVTRHYYNADGERKRTRYHLDNEVLYGFDETNVDLFQRGNLVLITRVADIPRGDGHGLSGPHPDIVVSYEYEPLYTQQRVITDPAGRASEYVYDYQEGDPIVNGVADLVSEWDINLGAIPLAMMDVNRDGNDNQNFGNPIVLWQPDASLMTGGRQAAIEGAPFQPIETLYRYGLYGQVVAEIDPEFNVKTYTYHPELDPDGDGTWSDPPLDGRPLDSLTGGYLASTTLDADPAPHLDPAEILRRDNGTNPPPAEIVNDYSYDPAGNLISSIDGNGVRTAFEVNSLGQIVSVRRGAISDRSINFDTAPPLVGVYAEQIYNERDEIVERRVQDLGDMSGTGGVIETQTVYDILGNAVSVGREIETGTIALTEYRFDGQGNRTATIFPEGNVHTLQFDERNLLYNLVRNDDDLDASNGSGLPEHSIQTYNYDVNGNLSEFVDGNGTSWEFVYDGLDRRTRAPLYPDFPAESFFDVHYNVDETIDRMQVFDTVTSAVLYDAEYVYDELGRTTELRQAILDSSGTLLTEDFDGDGYVSVYTEYDRNSRRSRVWTDGLAFTDFDVDGAGRMLLRTDAEGNTAHFEYDANNNVVETELVELTLTGVESFSTVNAYDRLNRLTSTINDLNHETTYAYDSRDNLIELTDAVGNTIGYSYDGLNRRIEVRRDLRTGGGPPGPIYDQIVYQYEYDQNNRAVAMTDPAGNVTTYIYDGLDRKIRDTYDDDTYTRYEYDPNDNVVEVEDANGSKITIAYDSADRPTDRTVVPATGVHQNTQTYSYDPLNRLIQATDQNDVGLIEGTSVWFEYDSLNRIRSESTQYGMAGPKTLNYEYDGLNRLGAYYPANTLPWYSYDPLNRLTTVQELWTTGGFWATYDYVGPERVGRRDHGNGTYKSYLDPVGDPVGYDGVKRVVQLTHYDPSATVQAEFSYQYDDVGNIIGESRNHSGFVDTLEYDSAYRVVEHNRDTGSPNPVQTQYTLDNVGNWLQRTINGIPLGNTPNNLNEYDEPQSGGTRVDDGVADDFDDDLNTPPPDGINLGHDANGNLVTEGLFTYEYDAFNRLVDFYDGGVQIAHYVYDGLNRRIVNQDLVTGVDLRYVYDGELLVEEWEVGGSALRTFYRGAGGELVAVHDMGLGDVYYLHDDVRGSIVMVTDPGGGIVERVTYGPYGKPEFQDAGNNPTGMMESLVGNPFLYQGQYWDPETGFYEDRAAKFAPRFGRHIQRHLPGEHLGPLGTALNVPWFLPCPVNWIGFNPFWWHKGWFWHPGAWHHGWWAWDHHWWWGGPWGWWRWRPWVWFDHPFAGWWNPRPWFFWWHHPFRWWGWQAWWPWTGWWGFWPYYGWFGWSHWLPVWGFNDIHAWWPWWGWHGWAGFLPIYGWWGWQGWWPGWSMWWWWHPHWWWGSWTWSPFWWHGYWGWIGLGFWRWCWGWLHWWPWGWWNWGGWLSWWGWFGWNPWWWWGWGSWWQWGWILHGSYWWWGPFGWNPWFWSWWPWWWWGWWAWLVPWGCWMWRIGWWGLWSIGWWTSWWTGWWLWPWWGYFHWWGWWWPWWGWF